MSGYGFELTFRLAMEPGEVADANAEPPAWALNFLQNLVTDPELAEPLATPNGSVEFLQVVGLTVEESERPSSGARAICSMRCCRTCRCGSPTWAAISCWPTRR